jgi:hypothetical protein
MGSQPTSLREALLHELCAGDGYCTTGLVADDLGDELTAGEITDMVLRGEGLDPVMDRTQRESVKKVVEDWLFDPLGRGARSGLLR